MKLEFLSDGAPQCPLVRLYDFNADEVARLELLLRDLASGRRDGVALHDETFIETAGDLRVILTRESRDRGARYDDKDHATVWWMLTGETWLEVAERAGTFCDTGSHGFQWLQRDGEIGVLMSIDGRW